MTYPNSFEAEMDRWEAADLAAGRDWRPNVHTPDCGLQGSGLDKSCTCHVDNGSRVREDVTHYHAAIAAALGYDPSLVSDAEVVARHLSPETRALMRRVLDLVGPAGAEAVRDLVVDVFHAGTEAEL